MEKSIVILNILFENLSLIKLLVMERKKIEEEKRRELMTWKYCFILLKPYISKNIVILQKVWIITKYSCSIIYFLFVVFLRI